MRSHLLICNGGSCLKREGDEVTLAIREEIAKLGADRLIHTTRTRCNGRCEDACVVIAYPEGSWYKGITPETGRQLVRKMLTGERLEEKLLYAFEPAAAATGNSVEGRDKP
jgi:(2Fe-2S) ferredoxin